MKEADQLLGQIEELQLTFGIGPCVDAFVWGNPILM